MRCTPMREHADQRQQAGGEHDHRDDDLDEREALLARRRGDAGSDGATTASIARLSISRCGAFR